MMKTLQLSSKILFIQEILFKSILVLMFNFCGFAVQISALPLMFAVKAMAAAAEYCENKSIYYCRLLSEIYSKVKDDGRND